MKGLLGSKLIGWGLVGLAVFVIAQAASGPKKESQKTAKVNSVNEEVEESTAAETPKGGSGGSVQSDKVAVSESIPVLSYYYIASYSGDDQMMKSLHTSVSAFDSQMNYLKTNGYKVVSLDAVYQNVKSGQFPKEKLVALTFNDGYANFYSNAYPVLKKYGFGAAVFVITNRPETSGFISWSQLKKLSKEGVIIGSQGVSNANLTKVGESRVRDELDISKQNLENEMGSKIKYFAYPYGAHNTTLLKYLTATGYLGAFSMGGKNASSSDNVFAIPRKQVKGGISLSQFAELLK